MKIIGIDPGSVYCGYGIISVDNTNLTVVNYGIIEVRKHSDNINLRSKYIYEQISNLVQIYKIDEASVEQVFYSKNVQSLVKLTTARTAAVLAVVNYNIKLSEYSPKEIKRAVTGRGSASKEQVKYMVNSMLGLNGEEIRYDATDALAIAICHYINNGSSQYTSSSKSKSHKNSRNKWTQFIKNNPQLVK